MRQLEQLPLDFPYICKKCRCDEKGEFDYHLALARLQKAATNCYKKLQAAVKRELMFLESAQIKEQHEGNVNLLVDVEAQELMQTYLFNDSGIPALISAEDNQLFRAVSVAFCARESLVVELRVRCCIEMVQYEKYYRFQKNREKIERCAPSFIDSCIDCAIMEEGSSAWTLAALASVVRRRILSVYPRVNGPTDVAFQALNTIFEPREKPFCEQTYRILWCSHGTEMTRGRWKPNTFVPVFDTQKSQDTPSGEDLGVQQLPCEEEAEVESLLEGAELNSSQDLDMMDSLETASITSAVSVNPSVMMEMLMEKAHLETAVGGFPIMRPRFMDSYEAYEKVTTAKKVKSDIPRGVKENVYFLLDNRHNVLHPERRTSFYDDCGVWNTQKSSTARHYFLLEDNGALGSSLKIVDGKFATQVKKDGINPVWTVLDPQPDPDKLVLCHKYYTFHRMDDNYKRRIIWFTVPPGFKGGEVAIAEYIGLFPGYPKSWRTKIPYQRTDPKIMEKIADTIKESAELTPVELLKKVQTTFGSDCPVRDKKQIANLKYNILKKMKQEGIEIPKREKPKAVITPKVPASKLVRPKVIVRINQSDASATEGQKTATSETQTTIHQRSGNIIQIRDGDKVHYVHIESTSPAKLKPKSQFRQEFVQIAAGPQPKYQLNEDEASIEQLQMLLSPQHSTSFEVQPTQLGYAAQVLPMRAEEQTPADIIKMELEEPELSLTHHTQEVVEKVPTQQMHLLQIQDGDETKLLQIPAGREVKVLQMEDGQQAISFVNVDADGVLDPNTETVIMIRDLLGSNNHGLGQEMTFI